MSDLPCRGTASVSGWFCDEFIEFENDPWAGTYCKLQRGHEGPCSPLYPDERGKAKHDA